MVHCIHNNHQNNKEGNLLDIVNEDLQQEMMLLSTNDEKDLKPIKIESDQDLKNEAFSVLSYDQVKRLHLVMEQVVPIHGKGNFPTLDIKLKDLVKVVKTKLETEQSIKVNDIRLNGGAASYVLLPENSNYNDLDLIFAVNLNDPQTYDKIRTAVLDSLLDFFPEGANRRRISLNSLKEAYIHKMVKVSEKDQWSLISLSNNRGRNVELKFVDTMKRQFEFSVDSFHIILDSLMLFYECSEMPIMENIYPTVLAESVYGNFDEAFMHLEKKIIATRQPEQIRGGGLLKYCNLLIRNYTPAQPKEIKNLERYMCSRFFIDFNELPQQKAKLESYLANHFNDDDWTKTQYLMQLYKVVDESTVCLMGHERRQTLALIEEMAYCFYIKSQQQHQPHSSHYQLYLQPTVYNKSQNFFPHFHHHHHHHPHHQMIRHPHFDVIVSPSQKNSANNLSVSNQNLNNSLNSNSGNATTNNSSNQSNNNTIQQSAHHHSNHNSNCKNSTKNTNNNASNNSTSQSQHIQQYHAYLFGTGANTFYYNPYHHPHNYQAQQHSCFNSCQCGAWMACA